MEQIRTPATHWRETPLVHILGPMQQFIAQSQSGGIILFLMTVVALALANSPFVAQYNTLLEMHIGISVGSFVLEESILHWINDGLMALFFFQIGLEIKREVWVGELANLRAATLPVLAAIGGAIVPALIYTALNAGGSGAAGWGVPMATDIAFALGCLALLGNRIPFSLKIFLTAVAIADDLIAVLVIAVFYSGNLNFAALGIGLALLVALVVINLFGIRWPIVYAAIGVLIWLAFLRSGVHATIAGVLIALTIPARNRIDAPTFLGRTRKILQRFEQNPHQDAPMLTDEEQQSAVIALEEACEDVQAPLQKMEHTLQGWVALGIMPVFALANAGVKIDLSSMHVESLPILLGIVLGLTLGKPLGLLGVAWLAIRIGIAELPQGVTWGHMVGAGILAGIGFTMSLFVATLGFADPAVLATAKIAILIASLIAGAAGMLWLRYTPRG